MKRREEKKLKKGHNSYLVNQKIVQTNQNMDNWDKFKIYIYKKTPKLLGYSLLIVVEILSSTLTMVREGHTYFHLYYV